MQNRTINTRILEKDKEHAVSAALEAAAIGRSRKGDALKDNRTPGSTE